MELWRVHLASQQSQGIKEWPRPRQIRIIVFFSLSLCHSIVEDGIMVQVSQERMLQIRKSLNQMEDCQIDCGPIGAEKPDETVYLKWVENDLSVNAGWVLISSRNNMASETVRFNVCVRIKSVIDGSPMDGITSVKVRGAVSRVRKASICFHSSTFRLIWKVKGVINLWKQFLGCSCRWLHHSLDWIIHVANFSEKFTHRVHRSSRWNNFEIQDLHKFLIYFLSVKQQSQSTFCNIVHCKNW